MMWWWMLGCATEAPALNKGVHRFPTRVIHVHGKDHTVEFACTPQEVALGLRYRVLQKDEGVMLCATFGSVSMKKMKSPISVAFISSEKIIVSVQSIASKSEDVPLLKGTAWVWEMPQGWFLENGIQEGMRIDGL